MQKRTVMLRATSPRCTPARLFAPQWGDFCSAGLGLPPQPGCNVHHPDMEIAWLPPLCTPSKWSVPHWGVLGSAGVGFQSLQQEQSEDERTNSETSCNLNLFQLSPLCSPGRLCVSSECSITASPLMCASSPRIQSFLYMVLSSLKPPPSWPLASPLFSFFPLRLR